MATATIIVVTYNSARWFARQRAALEALTYVDWKLVVVDNASAPDQRPNASDFPGAQIIQSEVNLGFAAANNLAANEADTPFLAFLNPDAFPEPGWLASLIATAERHPEAAAIGSTQVRAGADTIFDGTGDVLHASGIAYRSSYGRPRGPAPPLGETFSACAAAMLVRRAAFEAAGGFDESYFCFFEDVDLGFRLRLAGERILQSPDAVVAHVGGGATGVRSPFADFHGTRNRFWTFVKCMPPALFWPLFPAHVLACVLVVNWGLFLHGRTAPWRGLLAGFAGFSHAWSARQRVQRKRRVGSLEIARMLAWNPLIVLNRQPVIRRLAASTQRQEHEQQPADH